MSESLSHVMRELSQEFHAKFYELKLEDFTKPTIERLQCTKALN